MNKDMNKDTKAELMRLVHGFKQTANEIHLSKALEQMEKPIDVRVKERKETLEGHKETLENLNIFLSVEDKSSFDLDRLEVSIDNIMLSSNFPLEEKEKDLLGKTEAVKKRIENLIKTNEFLLELEEAEMNQKNKGGE